MKTVRVKLIGITPLLQHRMPTEELFQLLGAKSQKKKDKVDQTPREIAQKYAYQRENGVCFVPAEYLTGAFAHVAGDYKQRSSSRKSLKSIAKGIFQPGEAEFNLICPVSKEPITEFEVDVRKATNHLKGAVAVCRPRFDRWSMEATFMVDDTLVALETVQQILEDAGRRSGIGSFRVSKGGIFGQFRLEEFKILE